MKPRYAKEIRLLQPAYLAALLLAVVPVWLLPRQPWDSPENVALTPFIFGVVMLALSGFGREFSLQTFPLLLAQPQERRQVWRVKSALLAMAMLTVFLAWCSSCWACLHTVSRSFVFSDAMVISAAAVWVAFAGGLWTTLLLRQIAAAFWFTILIPGAIAMAMHRAQTWQVLLVLGIYAVAGVWWARHHFLSAQETAWTGGVVAFPGWRAARAGVTARRYRPWAALFWKELQLHQVGLVGMAWLFLMHLGVVGLRRLDERNLGDMTRTLLEVFGGVWIVVPLLVSTVSVAEERKLGTLAQQLSLPISRRGQFTIKLLFTLVIGGLLSAILVCTAEGIGSVVSPGRGIFGAKMSLADLAGFVLVFLSLPFLGFYASTLARNVVQALAAAVVSTVGIWTLALLAPNFGPDHGQMIPFLFWRGYLIYYFGLPALLAALFWLAWRNFRSESSSDQLWRRNALVLGSVLAGVMLATSAVYNRVWEFLTPAEPAPGAARILGVNPVTMRSYGGSALTAILPDGRLWVDRVSYEPGRVVLAFGEMTGFELGGHWASLSSSQIVPGSNWVSAMANFRETVALRSDGTLWVSEKPRRRREGDDEGPRYQEAAKLVRLGSETNWQDVVREHYSYSVVLLKQDGTLWRLGTNSFSDKDVWPGLRSFEPRRLVSDSGWDRILAGEGRIYAWKSDGTAWAIHSPARGEKLKENEMGVVIEAVPFLDNTKWRGLARRMDHQVGLREDGTLWAWSIERPPGSAREKETATPTIVRISPDSDWADVAGDFQTLGLRKTDGSLWSWTSPGWDQRTFPFRKPPVRLGSRHDWVAVGSGWGSIISLAADGGLYAWWYRGSDYGANSFDQPMLGTSRKPAPIENIFASQDHREDRQK